MFFYFGHSESSKKPTPTNDSVVKRGGSNIRQSASQRWSYTRMSPLLVGDKVPLRDKYWYGYTLLLKILDT